jgi:hypothetical protein
MVTKCALLNAQEIIKTRHRDVVGGKCAILTRAVKVATCGTSETLSAQGKCCLKVHLRRRIDRIPTSHSFGMSAIFAWCSISLGLVHGDHPITGYFHYIAYSPLAIWKP